MNAVSQILECYIFLTWLHEVFAGGIKVFSNCKYFYCPKILSKKKNPVPLLFARRHVNNKHEYLIKLPSSICPDPFCILWEKYITFQTESFVRVTGYRLQCRVPNVFDVLHSILESAEDVNGSNPEIDVNFKCTKCKTFVILSWNLYTDEHYLFEKYIWNLALDIIKVFNALGQSVYFERRSVQIIFTGCGKIITTHNNRLL